MPELEGTGRMSAQLHQLLRGLMVLRKLKEVSEMEVEIVERVAFGTIPSLRMAVIESVHPTEGAAADVIEGATGIPRSVLYRVLKELELVGLLKHEASASSGGRRGRFVPVEEQKAFFHHAQKTRGEL